MSPSGNVELTVEQECLSQMATALERLATAYERLVALNERDEVRRERLAAIAEEHHERESRVYAEYEASTAAGQQEG